MHHMAGPGRKGPRPKGKRAQFSVMFPEDDLALYRKQAADKGIPVGDYIAAVCATAHGRDEPDYVHRWPTNQPDLVNS